MIERRGDLLVSLVLGAILFLAGYFSGAYVTHRSLTTARAVTSESWSLPCVVTGDGKGGIKEAVCQAAISPPPATFPAKVRP